MAQIVLLSAIDKLEQKAFGSVCVLEFLKLLFCVNNDGELAKLGLNLDVLKDAKVCFNHFIRLAQPIQYENIAFALGRGAALLGPFHQPVFDIFIPFVLSNGALSCLTIQVKNYRDSYSLYEAEEKSMNAFFASLRSLSLEKNRQTSVSGGNDDFEDHPERSVTAEVAPEISSTRTGPPQSQSTKRQKANKIPEGKDTTKQPIPMETPNINVIMNLRQGHVLHDRWSCTRASKSGIIVIPSPQQKWKNFLWANGGETFKSIQSFLRDDLERKCLEERSVRFYKYFSDIDLWGEKIVTSENPMISE